MKKIILLMIMNIGFAQELKVDGNLKVMGKIDAQNQPITNVGNPTEGFEAVNLSTLSSFLGSDANYDYKIRFVQISNMSGNSSYNTVSYFWRLEENFNPKYESSWYIEFETIISDGYILFDSPTPNANGYWKFRKKKE
jgi:hypothetical protein